MTVSLDDMMAELDPERRRRVEERAAGLIAEEMTLRELRKARALTQASVARELGINQDAISRLEKRSDLLLSTLRQTVEAMGGSLSLIALRSSLPASPNTTRLTPPAAKARPDLNKSAFVLMADAYSDPGIPILK